MCSNSVFVFSLASLDSSFCAFEQQQNGSRICSHPCRPFVRGRYCAFVQVETFFGFTNSLAHRGILWCRFSPLETILLARRRVGLNALAELLYFRQAVLADTSFPSTLILPTHFLNDARYLLDKSPRLLSANLAALRYEIGATSVDGIFALSC
jgi:hypothetical protein